MSTPEPDRAQETPNRISAGCFWALIAAYVGYAACFIYRCSFVLDGRRYFVLFDDAMISMCYAKTLAQTGSLAWFPGAEPVEGFTNPLWTFYIALWHLLPIPARLAGLPIAVSGAACMVLCLFAVRALARRLAPEAPWAGVAAVTLTAFYLPLNTWTLRGMEVGLLALITCLSVLWTLQAWRDNRFPTAVHGLLALALWVRIDTAVLLGFWAAFQFLADTPRRWKHARYGILVVLVSLGGQTLLRYAYFGEWLPNTYYLKMTGYPVLWRLLRGASVCGEFVAYFGPSLFVVPFLVLLFRRNRAIALLLGLFCIQSLYSVYVGGDAWEWWGGSNRFVSIVMPLFFVLFALGLDGVRDALLRHPRCGGMRSVRWTLAAGSLVVLVACVVQFNMLRGPRSLAEWALLRRPLETSGADVAGVRQARYLKTITRPGATVALIQAGTCPYFADRPMIDVLGKCDKVIARRPMYAEQTRFGWRRFFPGHLKWDYQYSVETLQPDVVLGLWQGTGDIEQYLEQHYLPHNGDGHQYWLKKDSEEILWDRIAQADGRL